MGSIQCQKLRRITLNGEVCWGIPGRGVEEVDERPHVGKGGFACPVFSTLDLQPGSFDSLLAGAT
ncbi:MAG: hypothetical protein ABI835_04290 [Chloroflexota bacterium]